MRYPAEETAERHQKILEEASRMFREQGLANVSVGDLMKAAGLTHGSFYNHFPSKQALIAECINHVCGQAVAQMQGDKPTEKGKASFVSRYLSVQARDFPGACCLMSTLGHDVSLDKGIQPAFTKYVQTFVSTLLYHFPWSSKARARRDAIRMTASMVGALVLARAVDDAKLSKEILRDVKTQYTSPAKPSAESP